jgi:hypothetical protein
MATGAPIGSNGGEGLDWHTNPLIFDARNMPGEPDPRKFLEPGQSGPANNNNESNEATKPDDPDETAADEADWAKIAPRKKPKKRNKGSDQTEQMAELPEQVPGHGPKSSSDRDTGARSQDREISDFAVKLEAARDRGVLDNKPRDPAFLDEAAAKGARDKIDSTWVSFQKYAKPPEVMHADAWPLRMAKMKILIDAMGPLDRGFFTRRHGDWTEIRTIEKAVGPHLIGRYEAIAEAWWHHAAFVSHFGRISVDYHKGANGDRGNEPMYNPPHVSKLLAA